MRMCHRKWFSRPEKSVLSDESGLTAIEFTFVLPVILMLMATTVETGFVGFTEYVLQSSVQQAARKVRVGTIRNSTANAKDAFKKEICALVGKIVPCDKVIVYLMPATTFSTLRSAVPSPLGIGPSNFSDPANPALVEKFDTGSGSEPVALIATYDWKFSIPYFLKPLGNVNGNKIRRIYGMAIFRNES